MAGTRTGVWRKVAIGCGVLIVVIILGLAITPLFVDVDHYRPQIMKAADEHLNGKLDLGKLHLSLWGQIKVRVDGFTLTDEQGRKVVSASDVYFHVPFSSILSGHPVLTLSMDRPELFVVKNKAGKLNVMTLVKSAPKPEEKPAETTPEKPAKLPSIVVRSRLGIDMKDALLSYRDEAAGSTTQVKDLNVTLKDLSLSHPTEMLVTANLDTKMGRTMTLKGPAKLTATFTPRLSGSEFQDGTLDFRADMDGVDILMPDTFHKRPGIASNAQGALKVSSKEADIRTLDAKFFNAVVNVVGNVTDLDTVPKLDLHVKSNDVALAPWSELIPPLKSYELGGTAFLTAVISGTSAVPKYQAEAGLKNVTAKAPSLKVQPRIDALLKVVTDQVESLSFTMKAPGNNLEVTGHGVSFTKPRIDLKVTSTGMDLDNLIEFPKGPAPEPHEGTAANEGKKPASDLDASLDALRENKILADTVMNVVVQMTMVKLKGARFTDIISRMSLRDLTFAVDQFQMKLWGGQIKSTMNVGMKPKVPAYRFSASVAKLDLQQAVASQFELFKNTLLGSATFGMDGNGASFNTEKAKLNLNAKGNMKVENATFQTIDIGKIAADAINKSIGDIAAKIPGLKGKTVSIPKVDSRYSVISSDFTIAGGKFNAPNFTAKSEAGKGIDLSGATTVGLLDYSLNAKWDLIDTHNLTHARDLSVDEGGVKVDHILAAGNKPVEFPIVITGTCFNPSVNYSAVPDALAKVALANVTSALTGRAKAEAHKQMQNQINKIAPNAPPAVQKAIQGLGKRLFGQ